MSGINPSSESTGKPLAELVKIIRNVNELTQASLGKLFDPPVTQSTIARWENGEQMPDKVHFPKIAYFVDLTLEDLERLVQNPQTNLANWEIKKKALSPNKKHFKVLKRGVTPWNRWRDKNPDVIPELAGIELQSDNLDGINLNEADLRGIKLRDISLENSSLVNANLDGANLKHVYFKYANLSNANLSNTSLQYVHFDEAKLIETVFNKANINIVSFKFTRLNDANFRNTKIVKVCFQEANCNRASFDNAIICNSSVYGASFWGSTFDKVKLENIFIAKDDKDQFPVNNLEFSHSIYLQRCNRLGIKKFIENFKLEEKAISLAYVLVDKYGNYSHTNDSSSYSNYGNDSYLLSHIYVIKRKNFLDVVLTKSSDSNLTSSLENNEYISIIRMHDGIIESNLHIEDIEVLDKTVKSAQKKQRERVDQIFPVIMKILELKESNKVISTEYILEKRDKEVILFDKSEYEIEVMKLDFSEKKVVIHRSSLEDKHLIYFQKLLIEVMSGASNISD